MLRDIKVLPHLAIEFCDLDLVSLSPLPSSFCAPKIFFQFSLPWGYFYPLLPNHPFTLSLSFFLHVSKRFNNSAPPSNQWWQRRAHHLFIFWSQMLMSPTETSDCWGSFSFSLFSSFLLLFFATVKATAADHLIGFFFLLLSVICLNLFAAICRNSFWLSNWTEDLLRAPKPAAVIRKSVHFHTVQILENAFL